MTPAFLARLFCLVLLASLAEAAEPLLPGGWRVWAERRLTDIEASFTREVATAEDWRGRRDGYRADLRDMLGLDPEPPRGELHPVVTGTLDGGTFTVDKLHFQSLPGLYVSANYYRPKPVEGEAPETPRPTILYVCGHGAEMGKDGRSNGNKTHYQHHGAWFASHGYNCLILDTVQWGEILGEHWGTYKLGRWWWVSRGYTPAGVETWNGMRALDLLASRPEVDRERIGVTGRSGGGAYTWYIAALDDRVKVLAPTAGITTLRDHVLGGCVSGHCDCMYMLNTRRWDFDRVAALAAPRPLLLSNTDKDSIFPFDGVIAVHTSVRRVYRLLGAADNLGVQFAEGPHHDSQPLHIGAFHWFNRHLQGAKPLASITSPALPVFPKEALRVFDALPADERNTRVDEFFVPRHGEISLPADRAGWAALRDGWMRILRERVLRWEGLPDLDLPAEDPPLHGQRALMLLGDSLDSLRTRELARHHAACRPGDTLQASGIGASRLLYASLFLPEGLTLRLDQPTSSHQQGPHYPGILRHFDLPQALAMAAERHRIQLAGRPEDWAWTVAALRVLGRTDRLILESVP